MDNKSAATALSLDDYRIRSVGIKSSNCERTSPFDGTPGVFDRSGKLSLGEVEGGNHLYFSFELGISGRPKAEGEEKTVFSCSCVVDCFVEFKSKPSIPPAEIVMREVGSTLNALAMRQCQEMIVGMGYPSPKFQSFSSGVRIAEETNSKASRDVPKKRTSKKKHA